MSQESAATKAMIRDQLTVLRRRMRREAPIRDAGGRVVDFPVAATSEHVRDVTGRGADQLRGRRLVESNPEESIECVLAPGRRHLRRRLRHRAAGAVAPSHVLRYASAPEARSSTIGWPARCLRSSIQSGTRP